MESHPLKYRSGYFYVALAAVLWAGSGTAAKFLFTGGISPYELVQMRTTLSFLGLFLWLSTFDRPKIRMDVRGPLYFAPLGIAGIAAAQFFYLFAISKIQVAAAILLHYTGPVFVALYGAVFLRRRLSLGQISAILGTLMGCFLVVGAYDLDLLSLNLSGIIGGILAALSFATYTILAEYAMSRYPPWTSLLYGLLFAALAWNVAYPPLNAFLQEYTLVQWWWIFFIATCGTILPFGLYFEGIRKIRSTHASVTATLEPITAAVISDLFLGEAMGGFQILGGLLVLGSITFLQWCSERTVD